MTIDTLRRDSWIKIMSQDNAVSAIDIAYDVSLL